MTAEQLSEWIYEQMLEISGIYDIHVVPGPDTEALKALE